MVPSSLNYYYEDGGTGNNGMEAALKEGRID